MGQTGTTPAACFMSCSKGEGSLCLEHLSVCLPSTLIPAEDTAMELSAGHTKWNHAQPHEGFLFAKRTALCNAAVSRPSSRTAPH